MKSAFKEVKPKTMYGKAALACFIYYIVTGVLLFANPMVFIIASLLPITGGIAFLGIFTGSAGSWKERNDGKTVPILVLLLSIPVLWAGIYFQFFLVIRRLTFRKQVFL